MSWWYCRLCNLQPNHWRQCTFPIWGIPTCMWKSCLSITSKFPDLMKIITYVEHYAMNRTKRVSLRRVSCLLSCHAMPWVIKYPSNLCIGLIYIVFVNFVVLFCWKNNKIGGKCSNSVWKICFFAWDWNRTFIMISPLICRSRYHIPKPSDLPISPIGKRSR